VHILNLDEPSPASTFSTSAGYRCRCFGVTLRGGIVLAFGDMRGHAEQMPRDPFS
jgi:hypothetical protein